MQYENAVGDAVEAAKELLEESMARWTQCWTMMSYVAVANEWRRDLYWYLHFFLTYRSACISMFQMSPKTHILQS